MYNGKTYNSVDNIAQFFAERGMPPPSGLTRRPEQNKVAAAPATPDPPKPPVTPQRPVTTPPVAQQPVPSPQRTVSPPRNLSPRTAAPTGIIKSGAVIQHPKYGRGTVLRREGDGDDAKLTISFPAYGLKKIVEKYAGIKIQE
jgi:DNA helicase-2/ATP-dependent DNA helicase PcrA